jgi:YidC/Oxa1 family membrane protein insertase
MSTFLDAATGVVLSVLQYLTLALAPINGGAAAVTAVVVLTVAIRMALVPLALHRAKSQRPRGGAFLSLLVQAPVFAVLYSAFRHATVQGHRNSILTEQLFGVSLGAHGLAAGWPLLVLLVGFGAIATISARRLSGTGSPWWLRGTPYLSLVPVLFVPLAAGIYLLTSAAWTAGETALLPAGAAAIIRNPA